MKEMKRISEIVDSEKDEHATRLSRNVQTSPGVIDKKIEEARRSSSRRSAKTSTTWWSTSPDSAPGFCPRPWSSWPQTCPKTPTPSGTLWPSSPAKMPSAS